MKEIVRPDAEAVWDFYGRRIIPSSGEFQKAECPLLAHDDKNPSASVNVETGKWQCWSCDGRGDTLDIIIANEETCAGLSDALDFAASHFATGGRAVRSERGRGGGLSVRPSSRQGRRNWKPPWSLS